MHRLFNTLPEDMHLTHIENIKAASRGHFFSPGATSFFKSRYPEMGLETADSFYFVTSEITPSDKKRRYTIRKLIKETGSVSSFSEFMEFATRDVALTRLYHNVVKGEAK